MATTNAPKPSDVPMTDAPSNPIPKKGKLPPNTAILKPPLPRPSSTTNPSRPVFYISPSTPLPALITRTRKSFERAALRGTCVVEVRAAGRAIPKAMRAAVRFGEMGWVVKVRTEEVKSHRDVYTVDSEGEEEGFGRKNVVVNTLALTVTEGELGGSAKKKVAAK